MTYRTSAKPEHDCLYHRRYIQASVWGKGWTGWWNLRCIMCGAVAPLWRWVLLPFLPTLDRVPAGPGPYHKYDPRLSDADLRREGISEKEIRARYRDPEWVSKLEKYEKGFNRYYRDPEDAA